MRNVNHISCVDQSGLYFAANILKAYILESLPIILDYKDGLQGSTTIQSFSARYRLKASCARGKGAGLNGFVSQTSKAGNYLSGPPT